MQDKPRRTKRAVNLSIDADLLAEAKALGTNMSATLERALSRGAAGAARAQVARGEPRGQCEPSNRFIKRHGLLSDDWRKF